MTQLERDAIHAMLDGSAKPVVDSRYIDKLDSAEFTLGWHLAHQRLAEWFGYLLRAKPADLRRYVRAARADSPTTKAGER